MFKPAIKRIIDCLAEGHNIRNFGGPVCDEKGGFLHYFDETGRKRAICTLDVREAIDVLAARGIKLERLDSGGSPTWGLVD